MVDANLLARLAHALIRINQTQPRNIPSPPTQPRRASVAILIRVRPNEEDDEWLSEQYDADGQPLPESEAERIMTASQADLMTSAKQSTASAASLSSSSAANASQLPHAGQRTLEAGVSESFTSDTSAADASFMGASGVSGLTDNMAASSAIDLGGESTGDVARDEAYALAQQQQQQQQRASSGGETTPSTTSEAETHLTLQRFFSLPWVQRGQAEVLYIKRASRETDKWSGDIAYPGGRSEPGDENGLYTAMRETWEEIGLDLAEKEFVNVGKLDDREITTSLGKRLLMVLSPYVFIQTSPFSPIPDLQPSEVASAHWIPLSLLYTPKPKWGTTSVDIASRLAPKSPAVRFALRGLVGKMDFRCILLPNKPVAVAEADDDDDTLSMSTLQILPEGVDRPDLKLWGLTLGMTLDLLAQMSTMPGAQQSTLKAQKDSLPSFAHLLREPMPTAYTIVARLRDELHLSPPPAATAMAPSMTSVFPRFSYPDVNFWIWVFGWRYRTIVRSWERNIGTGMEQSVNWSGMALGAFYSAVRRALVVAILLRALGFASTFSAAFWLLGRRIRRSRRGQSGFGLEELLPSLDK